MAVARRILVLSIAAAALFASAACSGDAATPTPTSAAPTAILGEGATPPPTAATTSPTAVATTAAPASYPSSARAYAEAILAAWSAKKLDRLGLLTSAEVQEQLIEIPGPIDTHWHYSRCDGAAGSSYCVFFNNPGDMITLRVANAALGTPHAGTSVMFDQVTFPAEPVDYVMEFVGAWQAGNTYRMKILANDAEVSYFTHYTPPAAGTAACFADGTAGAVYIRVYNGDGLEYLLKVTSLYLSKPHAISGHANPSGSNCV